MRVSELIEKLKELPQDLLVCSVDEQAGEFEVEDIVIKEVYLNWNWKTHRYEKCKAVVLE